MKKIKKNQIHYQDGLAIVNREGLYHIHLDTPEGRECKFEKVAPLCVSDEYEVDESIRAYKTLVPAYQMRQKLRTATMDIISDMGAGKLEKQSSETLCSYAKQAALAGAEVANSLVPSYVVVQFDCDTEDEEMIVKTRTFSDAVAWSAVRVENEDIAILDDMGCYTYRVYPLNYLGQVDDNAPILYETRTYAK